MKKAITLSLILSASFISSNTLAEWTIPGTDCVSESTILRGPVEYHDNAVINNRKQSDLADLQEKDIPVICSSQVHNSYGSNLDMDFTVFNRSKDQVISCKGYSLDRFGNIVQETVTVSQKKETSSPTTLSAGRLKTHSTEQPITVAARCLIPVRSVEGKKIYYPSAIVRIRVY